MMRNFSFNLLNLWKINLNGMKRKSFFLLFAVALAFLPGCNRNSTKVDLYNDECGVTRRINIDEKNVYLVFTAHYSEIDSGYFENFDGVVPVLDILKEKDVKGSFFPTGCCFRQEKYKDAIQRIIDEGHYLSAHSNNHLELCSTDEQHRTLVSADSLAKDIAGMEAELAKFGLKKEQYRWMIPPYESYNKENADDLRNLGYMLCNPTYGIETSLDWAGPDSGQYCSAEELVSNIWLYDKIDTEHGLNGCIILIHAMNYPDRTDDDRVYTHLGEIIDGLRDRGYGFKTFKDLL